MSVIRLYRLALPKTERYYRATAVCMGYFNAMLTEFTTLNHARDAPISECNASTSRFVSKRWCPGGR